MPLPALLLPILAAAAAAAPGDSEPVIVTGHAWAPFISPMGEPFRARTASDDTLARWFAQADADHDGAITAAEMQADASRFFATLDKNGDGEIDPEEIVHYEWEIAPDIQLMAKTRRAPGAAAEPKKRRERRDDDNAAGRLQGAARYGLLNLPEPVAAADADFNRGVSAAEFRQAALNRFQLLDTGHAGRLTLAELEAVRTTMLEDGKRSKRSGKASDTRVGTPLPPRD